MSVSSRSAMKWLACALLIALAIGPSVHAQLDGFDEEPAAEPSQPSSTFEAGEPGELAAETAQQQPTTTQKPAKQARPAAPPQPLPTIGRYEVLAGAFLVIYMLNVAWGRYMNNKKAKAWSKTFAEPGGLFDKNFSALGSGPDKLMQEAGNVYKFYASGRRHVLGLLATLNLRARQDILSMLWYIISPCEDTITLEAFMTEASMPPIVVAMGTPKHVRKLAAEQLDVIRYTKKIQAPKDSMPGWPNDKFHIHTEHSNIFTELFSDPRVLQTFSLTGPNAKSLKLFRTLHFTNDCSDGSHKRVLRFTFALPSAESMEDLVPLMALVPLFIDLVGSYKLSPELKKKAEAARAKGAETHPDVDQRKQRLEALAMRKQEKLLEEKAKIARLPPAERQKAEDKLQKKAMEKQMKKRTKTM